ncbi:MAG: endonuclease MutS2 [Candidatus Rokuibacteriota bacterium]
MRHRLGAGRVWERGTEWDAVRALLATESRTSMGRERALTADPFLSLSHVEGAIASTTEARRALAQAGPPPLDTVPDVRPALERCETDGAVLEGAELALLIPLLDAGPRLAAWGRGVAPVAPGLAGDTVRIPRLADLRDTLRHALEDDGSVTDRASAPLARLRREIRERRRKLVADCEQMLGQEGERVFADRFVTMRHGRYVLPVRAEARQRAPGIVHDRSQSGQTIFVEPQALVEANNALVQALRAEEQEIARILAALTDAVRARLAEITALVDAIGELDWIFARAHFAERAEATAPAVAADGRVEVRAARHPLLQAQAWKDPARGVVPIDLELGPDRPLLLLTGPNAGGKTIALKTLALLVLMAQSGCHVPAAEGARLPVFERMWAIVGDDQSVAENLSTFSAFVKQIREVLDEADGRSLVLLDELGAGTDPDEGAALAQAILEALEARGALVVATTHLEPLRVFAATHPRARNASVEFDTATLAPTFRLRYDTPGQSYALTIAGRLGLSPGLIARAQAHRSAERARMSDLIARLDRATRDEAERTLALERRESEVSARLGAAREAEATAGRRAREIVERAKAEAQALLVEIRRAVSAEWDRLKRSDRTRSALRESQRVLHEAAARIAPAPATSPDPEQKKLTPGSAVAAEHLGLRGELLALSGDTATVRSGSITVRVPLSALRRVDDTPGADRPRGPAGGRDGVPRGNAVLTEGAPSGSPAKTTRAVSPELMLIGRTTDEARDIVEQYLDDAFMSGLASVRLVHGKGTGALRKSVRGLLEGHPLVESFRDGEPYEGGAGATVAALRVG